MKVLLVSIREGRTAKNREMQALVDLYVSRAAKYLPCETEVTATEQAFWNLVERSRSLTHSVLLDQRGEGMSSEDFAGYLRRLQDTSVGVLILGIGPADGWSPGSLRRATRVLSLSPMTLPHELARVVLAEQVYRALTILAGHPYHSGH